MVSGLSARVRFGDLRASLTKLSHSNWLGQINWAIRWMAELIQCPKLLFRFAPGFQTKNSIFENQVATHIGGDIELLFVHPRGVTAKRFSSLRAFRPGWVEPRRRRGSLQEWRRNGVRPAGFEFIEIGPDRKPPPTRISISLSPNRRRQTFPHWWVVDVAGECYSMNYVPSSQFISPMGYQKNAGAPVVIRKWGE